MKLKEEDETIKQLIEEVNNYFKNNNGLDLFQWVIYGNYAKLTLKNNSWLLDDKYTKLVLKQSILNEVNDYLKMKNVNYTLERNVINKDDYYFEKYNT